jgi:hypothetical protein
METAGDLDPSLVPSKALRGTRVVLDPSPGT